MTIDAMIWAQSRRRRPGLLVGDPIHPRAAQPSRICVAGDLDGREAHDRAAAWTGRLRRFANPDPLPGEPT